MSLFSCITSWLSANIPILYYFFVFFGFVTFFKIFMTVAKGVKKLFRNRINFQQRYGKGAWALVTGGSEGIGRELACQLAS